MADLTGPAGARVKPVFGQTAKFLSAVGSGIIVCNVTAMITFVNILSTLAAFGALLHFLPLVCDLCKFFYAFTGKCPKVIPD